MTDKPEVRGYEVTCDLVGSEDQHVFGMNTKAFAELTATGDGAAFFELIRLTDHEAARAADKARIAELEIAESELKAQLSEALMAIKTLCPECKKKWLYRHCGDAALAQQGKEGEV